MVQMSGGAYEMDYDQEFAYFSAKCLAQDVVDIFGMVVDCALEPRSVVAANVGIYKNKQTHKLDKHIKSGEEFND
jgi:processing peptidase subunit beta